MGQLFKTASSTRQADTKPDASDATGTLQGSRLLTAGKNQRIRSVTSAGTLERATGMNPDDQLGGSVARPVMIAGKP